MLFVVKGGNIEKQEVVLSFCGIKILVENLFFNMFVRLKYMKSLQFELVYIIDIVNRFSLVYLEVVFILINDGKEMIKISGIGDLRQVIVGIYGLNIVKKMIEILNVDLDFEILGYVSLFELI